MRSIQLSLALCLAASCGATSPDPVSTVAAGPPFVYDATGPGKMHFVGRVWAACDEDMPEVALPSVKSSAMFVSPVLSHDDEGRYSFTEQNIMKTIMLLPEDHSLHEWLSDDEVSKARERGPGGPGTSGSFRRTAVDIAQFRPGAVVWSLVPSHRCRHVKDIYFEAAVDAKKRMVGLMPGEAVITLVDDDADARNLKALLADRDQPDRERARLLAALRAGDERAFEGGGLARPPLQSRLADHRAEWTARLNDLARQGEIFVELPISELVGPAGILAGLEKLGYTVQRHP